MDVKLDIPSREEGEQVGEAAGRTENGVADGRRLRVNSNKTLKCQRNEVHSNRLGARRSTDKMNKLK